MTPCRNQARHDPDLGLYGDCQRCCVAAILDLPPAAVPHFYELAVQTGRHWLEVQREWLELEGFSYVRFCYDGGDELERVLQVTAQNCPGVPLILGGETANGAGHSVVVMDGKIIMDPSGSGIAGPIDGLWLFEAIAVGPNWAQRRRALGLAA